MNKDPEAVVMTEGKPLPIIIRFSIPLVLSAFFQQLYSFVDSMIVGRCISTEALAAVNLTYSLNFMLLGLTMGSALGFCVPFAQEVGAKNREEISRYFWNGLYLSVALSLAASVIFVPLTPALLRLINTPEELFGMSSAYLTIIFAGLTVTTLYHYFAGIMRALGDSKHPFYFLLISSGINIILDLIFIVVFNMGVAGAAIATVISQVISAGLCIWYLLGRMKAIERRPVDGGESFMNPARENIKRLIVIGLPMGLELSVNSIGSVILQGCVNMLGAVVVAAVAAGEKIRSMLTLPLENLGTAMSTYTAQNYGARRTDRIKDGIKSSILILVCYCAFAWVLVLLLKKPLVSLLLGREVNETFTATVKYLSIISTLFVFHGGLQIFRNILQGMGHSTAALLSGVMEIIGRVIGGTLAVRLVSFNIVCVSNPMAWILAGAYCAGMTMLYLKKLGVRS